MDLIKDVICNITQVVLKENVLAETTLKGSTQVLI